MGFSPFLQTLFLLSIVTATSATDVPPAPPVAGLAANALPVAGAPLREKKRKGRVNKELVSGPVAQRDRPVSSVPKDMKKPPRAPKNAPSKNLAVVVAPRVSMPPLRAVVAPKIHPAVRKLRAVFRNLLTKPTLMPTRSGLAAIQSGAQKTMMRNARFGNVATRHLEVDLTAHRPGLKRIGNISHPRVKAVPSRWMTLPYRVAGTPKTPLELEIAAMAAAENVSPTSPQTTLLAMNLAGIPAEGSDILGGASGADAIMAGKVDALEREIARQANVSEAQRVKAVIEEDTETHILALQYLRNVFLPEKGDNCGTPDTLNGRPAIRPPVATRYKVPFLNGEAAVIVQDDPTNHLIILGQADAIYRMPPLINASAVGSSKTWDWQGPSEDGMSVGQQKTPSYLTNAQTSTFKVAQMPFYNDITNTVLIPQRVDAASGDVVKNVEFIPADAGSSISFSAEVGADVTVDGYTVTLIWVTYSSGAYILTTEGPYNLTGGASIAGYITKSNFTVPAATVGLYELIIANAAAPTVLTTSQPQVNLSIGAAPGDIVIPMGKSDGTDLDFFTNVAPQLRVDIMSMRGIFWAGFTENDEATFGQFDETEDGAIPPPSFDNWAALSRFRTKPMNDPANNGVFVPMIKRNLEGFAFQDVSPNAPAAYQPSEQLGLYLESTASGAEHVIIESVMGLTAAGLAQGLGPKPGPVNLVALAMAVAYARKFILATGNDEHEVDMEQLLLGFVKNMSTGTTYNTNVDVSGWLSGNDVTVV